MAEKYTSAKPSRIYTNNLYFAAYLHSRGYALELIRNNRRRVTFVFPPCAGVLAMREAFRSGTVSVDMRAFQESLHTIRRVMDRVITEERSMICPQERSPMQLSQA